ncbi:MAG: tetratricopeptide repeat protein [Verrucomicrobiota bacterium]
MIPTKTARLGFGLPTGIALAMLALAAVPTAVAADSDRLNASDQLQIQDDKSAPASQFLRAYNSMSMADWLNKKDMQTEAADLYTEALTLFLKISADYPQWQTAVVSFRINYCREALRNLQKADGGPTPDAGRQMPEDGLKKTADDGRPTTENQKSKIENQKLKINNLSPLNFKLQQAALKERERNYTGALVIYRALLEEFPQEPWALKGAGRCFLRLGRMDQARALTRQALTLPLPDAELNLLAALVACHDARYQAAIPLLRKSLKQNSTCPEAHAVLGAALAATGEMKEAQEEMKRALSLNPKLGDAYYNLASLSLWRDPADNKKRAYSQLAIDTARVHYQNALRYGAASDPELDALLAE